jgi:hypothetical protein
MKLVNDCGYSADRIKAEFQDTFVDTDGILRWMVNQQIPFQDMLADFRTLGLIDEDVQLYSNLVREKETDEFWTDYFNNIQKETV